MSDGVTKRCPRCDETKPRAFFSRNAARYDGLTNYCKLCERERPVNHEASRARKSRWYQRHSEQAKAEAQRIQREHPERFRAYNRVARALQAGKLVRPESCESCGRADFAIQAHHADYSKPLDVEWLCSSCHKNLHREQVA